MKKLYVYADFDWLKEVELIGELGYESLRGSDSYSFRFADSWIKKYNAITLSDDLNNQAFNIPNPKRIFSVVLLMPYPIDGDERCCFVESKSWHRKRIALFVVSRHLIS